MWSSKLQTQVSRPAGAEFFIHSGLISAISRITGRWVHHEVLRQVEDLFDRGLGLIQPNDPSHGPKTRATRWFAVCPRMCMHVCACLCA
jgi:hypothetical protein